MTTMEQEPFDKWPEAWLMKDNCEDQCAENRLEPNVPITPEQMAELGISYWKLDADAYTYPDVSIPWNPSDAKDPKLQKIREDRGYSYADIITVHPDYLPGYSDKIKSFFEEHIHDAEEIRYVLAGSGYFDVRDLNDKWVRVHVKKGDFMTLPEGTYIQDNWQRRSIAFVIAFGAVVGIHNDISCHHLAFLHQLLLHYLLLDQQVFIIASLATAMILFMPCVCSLDNPFGLRSIVLAMNIQVARPMSKTI
mmetsp:Transcript_33391/g.76935  ORF Transcript_33391/g.76935 Transcript_33391/m.76935 type:complete len:250 (-) Transcript_33391:1429-2178(-)